MVLQAVVTAADVIELDPSPISSAVEELTASVTMTATWTARSGKGRTFASMSSLSSPWFRGAGWMKRAATLLKAMIKSQTCCCNVTEQRQHYT